MLKYVTPIGATPSPHSYIGDISGNYERISTKFSVISLQTSVMSLISIRPTGKYVTHLGATPSPHSYIGDISGKYERVSTKLSVISLGLLTRAMSIT